MHILFGLILGYLGAVFGSFAGAQVWRLRARQLVDDKKEGREFDESELKNLKPLIGKKVRDDRSRCLHCRHDLAWYDLLPVVSWLGLGGKCRYCRKPIGYTEILLEVTLGALFGLSFLMWPEELTDPLEVVKLGLWLVALVALAINFVYDAKWFLLDGRLNLLVIGLGVIFSGITVYQSADWVGSLVSVGGSVLILGGLYGVLWLLSKGRWVGEGDIYLGTGLALFLADWQVAFLALFAANVIGTLLVLPGMVTGKLGRGSQVPFGPLLIAGAIVAWFVGDVVLRWYQTFFFI